MLTAVAISATLNLVADFEVEEGRLEGQLSTPATVVPSVAIPSQLERLQLFVEKGGHLREALDAGTILMEPQKFCRRLSSVTIYPDGEHGREAEVVAKVADLLAWAANDNAAPRGDVMSSSIDLVAGTGFEPVTFRL